MDLVEGGAGRPRRRGRTILLAVLLVVVLAALPVAGLIWWLTRDPVATPKPHASFRAHERSILTWYTAGEFEQIGPAMAFSPDGRTLASGGEDGAVRLRDADTGALLATFPHEGKVEYTGFTPDGRTLVAEGHGSAPMLFARHEPGSGGPPPPSSGPGETSASSRSMATLWSLAEKSSTGVTLFTPPRVAAREGGTLRLLPPSGRSDGRHETWDAAIRRTPGGLWAGLVSMGPVLISPDGRAYARRELGFQVEIRDARSGQIRLKLTGHQFRPPAWAFSPDGRWFAAGCWDGVMFVYDLKTGRVRSYPTPDENRTPLAFSPDGRLVATAAPRSISRLPASYDRLPAFLRRLLDPYVRKAFPIRDPRDSVVLWELSTGRPVALFEGHDDAVTSMVFSPDGRRLATADFDGIIKLWDVP